MGFFSNLLGGGVLFALALLLMAAELFLPSHGILSVMAGAFAIGGVVVTYLASPLLGVAAAIIVVLAAPLVIYWAVRLYPNTSVGKRVMLRPPNTGGPTAQGYEALHETLAKLAGKRGTALTNLRPAGTCDIDGQRIDCVSESTIIPVGAPVEVVRVLGMKVTVREVKNP